MNITLYTGPDISSEVFLYDIIKYDNIRHCSEPHISYPEIDVPDYYSYESIHPSKIAATLDNIISEDVKILTQSDHVINYFRIKQKEGIHNTTIKFFPEKGNPVDIRIDKQGTLESYPEGLLDQWTNDLFKLI